MFDRDLWAEIFHSIKKNKLRTFLTGFSVAWGIFILVLLLASVKGMQNGFISQFNDNATNSIFVVPGRTTKSYEGFKAGRRIRLTNDDLSYIVGNFSDKIEYVSPRFSNGVKAKYKKEVGDYPIRAVTPQHVFIEKTKMTAGRFIGNYDVDKKRKVVVIGKKVKEDLFGKEDPVGKNLIMNNINYKIIGTYSDDGGEREESHIYMPVSTLQKLYGNTDEISVISLTYNPRMSYKEALDFSNLIEVLLKRRHRIHPDDLGAIAIDNYAEEFSDIATFTKMLSVVSIAVGILILLAGIVGIGNILVFIIKERTKEIGIRKALGAKPSQVISLVILESIFITIISGVVGMLFAMLLVNIIGPNIKTDAFSNPSVDTFTIITALIVLVFSGILAGLVPALKAANVKPIVALRAD